MRGASSSFLAVCVGFAAFQAGCADSTADIFQSGVGGTGASTSVQTGVTTSHATTATNATNATNGPSNTVATTNGPGPVTNATTTTDATTNVTTTNVTTSVSVQSSTTSGPPPGNKVACDVGVQCDTNVDVCCWDNQLMSGQCTDPDSCQPTSATSMPTAISCEFQFQCPGQICCAARYNGQDGQPYETAMCADSCDLPDRYLCNPQNPACPIYDLNGMQVQSTCKMSGLLPPNYYVCGF